MKTQSIILASLMSCVFFFIGCNKGKNNGNEFVPQVITPVLIEQGELDGGGSEGTKQSECGRVDIAEGEFITMQILPENIELGLPVKLRVENHTKEDLRYSTDFSLEYFNEDEWKKIVPSTIYYPAESTLFAGKMTEEQISLYSCIKGYNKTQKGRYRIIKSFDCSYGAYNVCAEFSYNPEYKCGRIDIKGNEYVTMRVIPEKISINTLHTLRIENHTKGVLNYGTPFSLEYFNGNDWEDIQLDWMWEQIELGIGAGETIEGEERFHSLPLIYNNQKKGRYRIIKEFSVSYNFPFSSKTDTCFNLCTEFEIE